MREDWSIIVHGGAKTIRAGREEANRRGCLNAARAGQEVLERGGSALEAVETAIRVLEEDPTYNAGYGSVQNSEGEVETDAAIMDGRTLDVGAVAAVKGVRNPITVAHRLLREKPVLLVGEGAARFAKDNGGIICPPESLIAKEKADESHDTVGCVAFDCNGDVAAGTSTGGLHGVMPGRVGDSPIPGGGVYAENDVGGVSFSGEGESILRLALAARLITEMQTKDPQDAAHDAIRMMDRVGGEAGVILIGPKGLPAFSHNSTQFAVAMATSSRPAQAFLTRDEWTNA